MGFEVQAQGRQGKRERGRHSRVSLLEEKTCGGSDILDASNTCFRFRVEGNLADSAFGEPPDYVRRVKKKGFVPGR